MPFAAQGNIPKHSLKSLECFGMSEVWFAQLPQIMFERIFSEFLGFFWIFLEFLGIFDIFWNFSECFGIFPNFGLDFPGISQALAAEVEAGPGLVLAVAGRRWWHWNFWNFMECSGIFGNVGVECFGILWNVLECSGMKLYVLARFGHFMEDTELWGNH